MIEQAKKIFITGIGGIGVSALAMLLKSQGKEITGSDIEASQITRDLFAKGVLIKIGQDKDNIQRDIDLLIYSAAVPERGPERSEAKKLRKPEMSYSEALGEIAAPYGKVIGVSGTNGKTTTTAMIGRILEQAYEDPTVVVGSKVLSWNSNVRIGAKKYLVLEADEYKRAFLNYPVDVAVITNIEADHLDYYRDIDDIKNAFQQFVARIKPGGTLIYNSDDENCRQIAGGFGGKKISFSLSGNGDITATSMPGLKLIIPGVFTWLNALAAASATSALGIPWLAIRSGLENFTGTWRRFELIGRVGRTDVISDYAHHPTGLKMFLETAFDVYTGKSILAIFQPHQKNRTKNLFNDFVKSMVESQVSDFIIPEIFEVAGRENENDKISSEDLVRELKKAGKNAVFMPTLAECEKRVRELIGVYDAMLFIGAGDIYRTANKIAGKS
ncbi:MAG: UDP-N-acetylmuramate--L-alanine ligase [bacterium]|nr:UDP-N-acetylmuramate--L-alanine ligase [bacterium]